mgnify:CR=1 FL=1
MNNPRIMHTAHQRAHASEGFFGCGRVWKRVLECGGIQRLRGDAAAEEGAPRAPDHAEQPRHRQPGFFRGAMCVKLLFWPVGEETRRR